MRVLIIADSPEFDRPLVSRLAPDSDRIIVTDDAIHRLPEKVIPHIVTGDFDTIQLEVARAKFPYIDFIHNPDQYSNDLEKAIDLALGQGATDIVLVCALGGRPDQNFASMSIAMNVSCVANVELRHSGMRCVPLVARGGIEKSLSTRVRPGCVISVLPVGDPATVSIAGTEYELRSEELRVGALGVSNRALSQEVVVTVHKGRVFFFCDE